MHLQFAAKIIKGEYRKRNINHKQLNPFCNELTHCYLKKNYSYFILRICSMNTKIKNIINLLILQKKFYK